MQKDDYTINSINIDDYDFIDFGCSNGKSIRYGVEKFEGKRGIGIDIDIKKVKQARQFIKTSMKSSEHTAICEDIINLSEYNLSSKVRFVTAIHFLEHLNSLYDAQQIINSAIKISEEFVYISQPFSDMDSKLLSMGFKTYYSDWTGHTNLMTSYDFYKICRNLYYKNLIQDFIIFATVPIKNSSSSFIHPLDSPINQQKYDEKIHPSKDMFTEFNGLYKDINLFIILNDNADFTRAITRINKEYKIIYDSRNNLNKKTDISIEDCDFVDIGFGKGNSLKFGVDKFGGKIGLGIDKDYKRLSQVQSKLGDYSQGFGYHKLMCEDIFKINSLNPQYYKQFRFSIGINLIEEFNSPEELVKYIKIVANLSTDFSFISHVNNDYDDYFNSLGLTTSTRKAKQNHLFMKSDDYIKILSKLKYDNIIKDFMIFKRNKILDSTHVNVAHINNNEDDVIELDDVYISMDVFILFNDNIDVDELSKYLKGEKVLLYSSI